jgi:glycosyltransferase involved in cell wall biosynthesis
MADVATENGISKKIRMQTGAWAAAGHVVRYFASVPRPVAWSGLAPLEADLVRRGNALRRIFNSYALCRHIATWQPDAIYFRYAHHSPGLPRLFSRFPTIAEINSNDLVEYDLTLSAFKRLYHRMTRERVLRPVRGFVAVTSELAERFSGYGKPVEVIGNSTDFAALPSLPAPSPDAGTSLIFVGNTGTPWHGLDRIGELAGTFPKYKFVVVGCTPEDYLHCSGLGLVPPNLQFLGMMAQPDYLPMLGQATAAIGTLGLYRKHMEEACPLKVREYLALGLPVIGAYQDTDIPPEADYFLRLPNNAEPLTPWKDRITAFIEHWRMRRVPRTVIAHLDVSVKEARRLAFMEKIVAVSRHG